LAQDRAMQFSLQHPLIAWLGDRFPQAAKRPFLWDKWPTPEPRVLKDGDPGDVVSYLQASKERGSAKRFGKGPCVNNHPAWQDRVEEDGGDAALDRFTRSIGIRAEPPFRRA